MRHFLLAFVVGTALIAQDTVRTYPFGETVITATREEIQKSLSPVAVDVISHDAIQIKSAIHLEEILQNARGIELKDYGGPSSAKLISMRGSTSEQVLVLLDGMPLNNPASGLTDLGLVSLQNIERVEIYHGGASGMYGSHALGGVINIISAKQFKKSISVKLENSTFDHRVAQLSLSYPINSFLVSANYLKEFQPDSSYRVHDASLGKNVPRVNSSTNRDILSANVFFRKNKFEILHAQSMSLRRFEVPNSIANNSSQFAHARQKDQQYSFRQTVKYLGASGDVQLNTSYQNALLDYHGEIPIATGSTRTHHISNELLASYEMNSWLKILGGESTSLKWVRGTQLESAHGVEQSVYVQGQTSHNLRAALFNRFSTYTSLRWDYFSNFPSKLSPKAGLNLSHNDEGQEFAIRASAGQSYRAPTFNERFWRGANEKGNPDIKPETANSWDVGIFSKFNNKWCYEAEVTYYESFSKNLITWQSGAIEPGFWSPTNSSRTKSSGIESAIRASSPIHTSEISFTYNKAIDQSLTPNKRLRFSPLYALQINNSAHWKGFGLAQESLYKSERFTDTQNLIYLKRYWTTNLFSQYEIAFDTGHFTFRCGVKNVFDAHYELFSQYPANSREFVFSIQITL